MLPLHFCGGLPPELEPGFREIAPAAGLALSPDGLRVNLKKGSCLSLAPEENGCAVTYSTKPEFFRACALLSRWNGAPPRAVQERACFQRCGLMLDCSRNAVPTVETLQNFLRRMALMGLDLALLYTEDTYEVPERPYFGYLRGRYSQEELRRLDSYADLFGIEMVPCMQTLAHLERALQFPCMEPLRDTSDILMVGEDETYAFLREIIRAASAPFRSRRIHIGMDEAAQLGRGRYLDRYGYRNASALMRLHLERLREIIQDLGLTAMMWSDMHFTAALPGHGIYPPDAAPGPDIIAGAPEEIGLVYWDYYHETEQAYANVLQKHAAFPAETIFAGGIWSWIGPAADYRKTMAATWPALEQCRKNGVREVFATAWFDEGAEANPISILYGLQLFAEYRYTAQWDEAELAARFRASCNADAGAFLAMSRLNALPGMRLQPEGTANPCKMLLYEDPLLPMFEADLPGPGYPAYYGALAGEFDRYSKENPAYALLFGAHARLSETLRLKCLWREQAARAVREKDRRKAAALLPLAAECAASLDALRDAWRALWLSTNKPFGFEVLDVRLGGAAARFRTAERRMREFAEGSIAGIPELSCEKLPVLLDEEGRAACKNSWSFCVSACRVGL